jgi:CheY-like chemotaxis protein
MDEATRAKVFEPFFTTKEEGKGTGMGLASVYGTVINHHGAIEVDSEVGKGTTITVCLPLSQEVEKEEVVKKKVAKVRAGAKSNEASILIVDDEKALRVSTARLLRHNGYKVVTCKDGAEAISYYNKSWLDIDLVILDMNMPVINGQDTFVLMREINPDVKAILATGYGLDNSAQEVLGGIALGHIQKPYHIQDLVLQIEKALGRPS